MYFKNTFKDPIELIGHGQWGRFGHAVAAAGDLNGDGFEGFFYYKNFLCKINLNLIFKNLTNFLYLKICITYKKIFIEGERGRG